MSNPLPPPPAPYPPPPPPVKRSGPWKWILLGCLGLTVVGVISVMLIFWFVSKSFTADPADVEAMAVELLDFEIPEGVRGSFAMDILGMQMVALEPVALGPGDEPGVNRFGIVLMGLPGTSFGDNREAMEKGFKDGMNRGGQDFDVETRLEPEMFTVRGEEIEFQVEIASVRGGATRRQYRTVLPGREKLLFLFLFGQGDGPDHAAVQRFLDTIR